MPTKKEKQPLSVTHPELASEAVGWDPTTISRGSNKKLLWRCPRDHEYEMTAHSRTGQNSGCPYCAGKRVLPGFNDLATTHPQFAKEADGWDPTIVTAGSHEIKNWKCQNCKEQLTAWFEVDHIKRLDQGGSNDVENLVALCRNCHGEKTSMENI